MLVKTLDVRVLPNINIEIHATMKYTVIVPNKPNEDVFMKLLLVFTFSDEKIGNRFC